MSVGDLKNNIRKLQTGLRSIKYEKDVDLDNLSKGIVGSFLPIYHYLFLDYSHAIAGFVANLNIELSGKTDLRFIEAMYKVLREAFAYKPPITKEQFFANGFVERKIIMCTEIIQRVRDKHRTLAPKSSKSRPSTATCQQTAKLGPRQTCVSANNMNKKSGNIPDTTDPTAEVKSKPPKNPVHSQSDHIPVQVVNEIRHAVASSLTSTLCESNSRDDEETSPECKLAIAKSSAIEPKVIREERTSAGAKPVQQPWGDMRAVVVTSREQESKLKSGYNPARYKAVQEDEEIEMQPTTEDISQAQSQTSQPRPASLPAQLRPIDMIAMTPARPEPSRVTALPKLLTVTAEKSPDELAACLNKLEKSVTAINSRVLALDSRLAVVEGMLDQQQQQMKEPASLPGEVVTPEQLETLLARITLVENKVALVQAQKASSNKVMPPPRPATMGTGSSGQVLQEQSAAVVPTLQKSEPAMACSPIQGVLRHQRPGTQDDRSAPSPALSPRNTGPNPQVDIDRRWSSTPIAQEDAPSQTKTDAEPVKAVQEEPASQAERIRNMLNMTKNMLNLPLASPNKN